MFCHYVEQFRFVFKFYYYPGHITFNAYKVFCCVGTFVKLTYMTQTFMKLFTNDFCRVEMYNNFSDF